MKLNWKSTLIIVFALIVVCSVYFVITATMSSPVVMELKMPKDELASNKYQNSNSKLTLVLLKNNMVYGYFGNDINKGTDLEIKEVRNIILEGIQKFTKDSLVVLIKPSGEATYENTVNILDQIAKNEIKRYEMIDLNKEEKEFITKN